MSINTHSSYLLFSLLAVSATSLVLYSNSRRSNDSTKDESNRASSEQKEINSKATRLFDALYELSQNFSKRTSIEHLNVQCSECCRVVTGVRYVCTQCSEWDICEDCERDNQHSRSHILYKIRSPIPAPLQSFYDIYGPWQSLENIRYLQDNYVPTDLPYPQIEKLKWMCSALSADEISALYEVFRNLIDTTVTLSDTDWAEFSGGIRVSTFRQLLPTNNSSEDYLSVFLEDIYDSDRDGVISLPGFVQGFDLIINSDVRAKVKYIVNLVSPNSIVEMLRKLLYSYLELCKEMVANALALQEQTILREKSQQVNMQLPVNDKSRRKLDGIIQWREGIDIAAAIDPIPRDPGLYLDMSGFLDSAIEDLLVDLESSIQCHDGKMTPELLTETIMADDKLTTLITAIFQAGII